MAEAIQRSIERLFSAWSNSGVQSVFEGPKGTIVVETLTGKLPSGFPTSISGRSVRVQQGGPYVMHGNLNASPRGIHPKLDAAGQALWARVNQTNPGQISWVGFENGSFWVHQGGCVQTSLQLPSTWAGKPVQRRMGGIVSVLPPAWVWPKGSRCTHGVPTGSANAMCSRCGASTSSLLTFGGLGIVLLGLGAASSWAEDRRGG